MVGHLDELEGPGVGAAKGEEMSVVGRLPDFVGMGAMKCATTTLHKQLAAQLGIFMSTPKVTEMSE